MLRREGEKGTWLLYPPLRPRFSPKPSRGEAGPCSHNSATIPVTFPHSSLIHGHPEIGAPRFVGSDDRFRGSDDVLGDVRGLAVDLLECESA